MDNLFNLAVNLSRVVASDDPMSAPFDYLYESSKDEPEESLKEKATRIANREVPDGCTCPNNGGGDCPWCVIYFDIMDGNVDSD